MGGASVLNTLASSREGLIKPNLFYLSPGAQGLISTR